MIPWQPMLLALANRARDGWITEAFPKIKIPGQAGRLLWAIPFAVALYFALPLHWEIWQDALYFLVLVAAAFGGAALAAWGRYDAAPIWWLPLAVEGTIFTGLAAFVVALISFKFAAILLCSGLIIAPCYWLGWKLPGTWHGTPWGSLLFGLAIGLFIYLGA